MKYMTHLALKESDVRTDMPPLPRIVVYIKPLTGYSNMEVQNTVRNILDKFVKAFALLEEWGTGVTPRYNHQINKLIYYAQGHGYLKEKIIELGDPELLQLMDPEDDYAHFNCLSIGYPDDDCHIQYP